MVNDFVVNIDFAFLRVDCRRLIDNNLKSGHFLLHKVILNVPLYSVGSICATKIKESKSCLAVKMAPKTLNVSPEKFNVKVLLMICFPRNDLNFYSIFASKRMRVLILQNFIYLCTFKLQCGICSRCFMVIKKVHKNEVLSPY